MISTRMAIRLTPRASRNHIVGWSGDRLLVRVTAPPVDGKANAALLRLLADALDIPVSRLRLVAGASSRDKILEVAGLTAEEAHRRLNQR
jgi:hypothetical protein